MSGARGNADGGATWQNRFVLSAVDQFVVRFV